MVMLGKIDEWIEVIFHVDEIDEETGSNALMTYEQLRRTPIEWPTVRELAGQRKEAERSEDLAKGLDATKSIDR